LITKGVIDVLNTKKSISKFLKKIGNRRWRFEAKNKIEHEIINEKLIEISNPDLANRQL
jgi:hypothetical protein